MLLSNATENSISNEQSLREILTQLQIICDDIDLDFDMGLDKANAKYEEHLIRECKHSEAFPMQDGSVYCPGCDQFIIKGDVKLWRH